MPSHHLTLAVLTLLATSGLAAAPAQSAEAALDCRQVDLVTGVCLISVDVPAEPSQAEKVTDDGPADTGSGSSCWFDPSKQGITDYTPHAVPCSHDGMWWSNAYGCYFRALEPSPDASDPLWGGRDSADGGAIYECWQPYTDFSTFMWLASPPEASGAGPSPRSVALVAVDSMNLEAIEIGVVPEPRPGYVGVIGMPVWMWAANPGPTTVGPISASASAGGITVNATARAERITWSMGDGTTVVCRGAGTPYADSYGDAQSPDCGHTYTTTSASEPGGVFTVTATLDWVITWEGAGQSGTIRLGDLQRSVQVAVGEAQVLVTG